MKKNSIKALSRLYDEIKNEIQFITWPAKKDMILSVIVVGISVLIAGSIFFSADYMLYNVVQFLIKL
jgi:preprotein translocase SecE subunit